MQEMDWQKVLNESKEQIRQAYLILMFNGMTYQKAKVELEKIWAKLPPEEQKKRL